MHRKTLLEGLNSYQKAFPEEIKTISKFKCFVEETSACFERVHKLGHITGSAFVLSPDLNKLLFTHHAKLQKWLQLGGHADGCSRIHEVALREAIEESGISNLSLGSDWHTPIDIDIHEIPATKKEEAHLHYDVRYIIHSPDTNFVCSDESLALKWIHLDEITIYSTEESILRVVRKIQMLHKNTNKIGSN